MERKRKKTEKQENRQSEVCFYWTDCIGQLFVIRKKTLGDILCHSIWSSQTSHRKYVKYIVPCFYKQSSVISVACFLYCCVFVNAYRFFFSYPGLWVGLNAKREEKKPRGGESSYSAKCAFLRPVRTSIKGAKTNIYPMQNIILSDIIPINWKCASSHSKTFTNR